MSNTLSGRFSYFLLKRHINGAAECVDKLMSRRAYLICSFALSLNNVGCVWSNFSLTIYFSLLHHYNIYLIHNVKYVNTTFFIYFQRSTKERISR